MNENILPHLSTGILIDLTNRNWNIAMLNKNYILAQWTTTPPFSKIPSSVSQNGGSAFHKAVDRCYVEQGVRCVKLKGKIKSDCIRSQGWELSQVLWAFSNIYYFYSVSVSWMEKKKTWQQSLTSVKKKNKNKTLHKMACNLYRAHEMSLYYFLRLPVNP